MNSLTAGEIVATLEQLFEKRRRKMVTNKPEEKRYDMSTCPENVCRVLDMQESERVEVLE